MHAAKMGPQVISCTRPRSETSVFAVRLFLTFPFVSWIYLAFYHLRFAGASRGRLHLQELPHFCKAVTAYELRFLRIGFFIVILADV